MKAYILPKEDLKLAYGHFTFMEFYEDVLIGEGDLQLFKSLLLRALTPFLLSVDVRLTFDGSTLPFILVIPRGPPGIRYLGSYCALCRLVFCS